MSLTEIFSIIIIHWIADFVLQDEKWALGKSKNWSDLLSHTWTYSLIWFVCGVIYAIINSDTYIQWSVTKFFLIIFITHTIIDYITSRVVSKRFEKEIIFNLKISDDIFKEGDILQHGSNQFIIMRQYEDQSKVKWYNPIPNFGAFTLIGFDQVLHYVQLFLTYYYLVKI
jgi:hypothetical protein